MTYKVARVTQPGTVLQDHIYWEITSVGVPPKWKASLALQRQSQFDLWICHHIWAVKLYISRFGMTYKVARATQPGTMLKDHIYWESTSGGVHVPPKWKANLAFQRQSQVDLSIDHHFWPITLSISRFGITHKVARVTQPGTILQVHILGKYKWKPTQILTNMGFCCLVCWATNWKLSFLRGGNGNKVITLLPC